MINPNHLCNQIRELPRSDLDMIHVLVKSLVWSEKTHEEAFRAMTALRSVLVQELAGGDDDAE